MKIGIIAEDDSDVSVISLLTLAILNPRPVGFKKFVGDGCGKLRRKCGAWARNLVEQGCSWIVVVHDLDAYDEDELRRALTAAVAPSRPRSFVVLIPKREIEAWLLYDAHAIAEAFNERRLAALPTNPESLGDPKRFLEELVWQKYRKRYLHTLHNARIARHVTVAVLARSSSFAPHFQFATQVRSEL